MAPQVHTELTHDSRGSLITAAEDGVRQSMSAPKRGSQMESKTRAGATPAGRGREGGGRAYWPPFWLG